MANNSSIAKKIFIVLSAISILLSSSILFSRCQKVQTTSKSQNDTDISVNRKWIPVTERYLNTFANTHAGINKNTFSYAGNSVTLPPNLGSVEYIQTKYTITSNPCLNMVGNLTNLGNENWEVQFKPNQVMIISDPNSFEDYGNPRILKSSGTVVKSDLTKRVCALVEVPTLSN